MLSKYLRRFRFDPGQATSLRLHESDRGHFAFANFEAEHAGFAGWR